MGIATNCVLAPKLTVPTASLFPNGEAVLK
jgi:hypothetical protein